MQAKKKFSAGLLPHDFGKIGGNLEGKVKFVKTEKTEFEPWDELISVASFGHHKLWRLPYIEETTVFKNKICPKIIAIENPTEEVNAVVKENEDIENR